LSADHVTPHILLTEQRERILLPQFGAPINATLIRPPQKFFQPPRAPAQVHDY
jgi:hypothetical protein